MTDNIPCDTYHNYVIVPFIPLAGHCAVIYVHSKLFTTSYLTFAVFKHSFSDVFEEKMEMQQQKAKEMREKEFTELKER